MHAGGHVTDVRAWAQRVEGIGRNLGDESLQVAAQYYGLFPFYLAGDYRGAEQACRRLVDSLGGDHTSEFFGLAALPSVVSRSYLARALAEQGSFEEGATHGHEALRLADALDHHPFSVLWASLGHAFLSTTLGEWDEAARLLERAVALCREWSITTYVPVSMAAMGYAYAWSGRVEEGVSLLQQALAL